MQSSSRSKILLGGLAAAIVLAIAGGMLYGLKKTRDLESSAAAGVAGATTQLREAAALGLEAPNAAERLAAHAAALAQLADRLSGEDRSRNKALAEAAELYLVDAQAILRNQAATARALAAARASRHALAVHLEHAAERGPGWIDRALALKQKAERDNFDCRTAAGALAELLRAHVDTQDKLRAVYADAPLLEEEIRKQALKAAEAVQEKASAELERIRHLPVG